MKTYQDNGFRYFYDASFRLWTIYEIDKEGNQVSKEAEHFGDKAQLLAVYPGLLFNVVSDKAPVTERVKKDGRNVYDNEEIRLEGNIITFKGKGNPKARTLKIYKIYGDVSLFHKAIENFCLANGYDKAIILFN